MKRSTALSASGLTPGHFAIPVAALLSLFPFISSGVALILGMGSALLFGNPYLNRTRKLTPKLLAFSVVGLGAAMNLNVIGRVGAQGIGYTVVGIGSTFLIGILLGRLLGLERDASVLVTAGTAICGGSAIAAIAPSIGAKDHDVSVALGTVFLLNALALFIFPPVGHFFDLDQTQFGLWSALAIHDTSSVVGATLQYGARALEVGTTVKLARALWIVPVTFIIGAIWARQGSAAKGKPKRPWFILGFLLAAALVTWVPQVQPMGVVVAQVAKRSLIFTLFLIGANLTRSTVRSVGIRPFVQGVLLWVMVGSATLGAILEGWIHG